MNIFQIVTRLLTICIYFSTWFAAFISIDFGSSDSEPYTDENSITWTGDDAYIQSAESQFLKYSTMPYVRDEQSQGVLIAEKENCYKINVNEGEWVLVRASFYYGDYDLKFSLQFLTFNLIAIIGPLSTLYVRTLYEIVSYGAIFTVKANNTSICLAQTMPNQVPFISALELRSLLPDMYSQAAPNYAMFLNLWVAYGANDTISIRYACICTCFEF